MAEENEVMKEPQQIVKEPQGEATQPQQVTTTKNPKKVEAGKRLAVQNHRRRDEQRKETSEIGEKWSKPIL